MRSRFLCYVQTIHTCMCTCHAADANLLLTEEEEDGPCLKPCCMWTHLTEAVIQERIFISREANNAVRALLAR